MHFGKCHFFNFLVTLNGKQGLLPEMRYTGNYDDEWK